MATGAQYRAAHRDRGQRTGLVPGSGNFPGAVPVAGIAVWRAAGKSPGLTAGLRLSCRAAACAAGTCRRGGRRTWRQPANGTPDELTVRPADREPGRSGRGPRAGAAHSRAAIPTLTRIRE
jgi:hypothetical protein